jgi:hypothetical protein
MILHEILFSALWCVALFCFVRTNILWTLGSLFICILDYHIEVIGPTVPLGYAEICILSASHILD